MVEIKMTKRLSDYEACANLTKRDFPNYGINNKPTLPGGKATKRGYMKRIFIFLMFLLMMLISIEGCYWGWWDEGHGRGGGRGGGESHRGGEGHGGGEEHGGRH